MRMPGKRLSRQAREKLNTVLLEWIMAHKEEIDDCCLIAELFGKARWRTAPLTRLRAQMVGLLARLRVRYKHLPRCCEVATVETIHDRATRRGELWEFPSTTMKAAFRGLDHSTIIKNDRAVRAERL